jgi:alpha-tubulin suppressor-like RCC1 family protein
VAAPPWSYRLAQLAAIAFVAVFAISWRVYERRLAEAHQSCFGRLKSVPYSAKPEQIAALPELASLGLPETRFEQKRRGFRDYERRRQVGPYELRTVGYERHGQVVTWSSLSVSDPLLCHGHDAFIGSREIAGLDPKPVSFRYDPAADVYLLAGADGTVFLSFQRSYEWVHSFHPPWRRSLEHLALVVAAIIAAFGAWSLARAWRYFGRRGIAGWREGLVNDSEIELADGTTFPHGNASLRSDDAVLVSSPADASLLRYRRFAPISGPPVSVAGDYRKGREASLLRMLRGSHAELRSQAARRAIVAFVSFGLAVALAAFVPSGREYQPPPLVTERPAPPPVPPSRVVEIASGWSHTCARSEDGRVQCWGYNDKGKLGYQGVELVGLARPPAELGDVDVGERALQIATGPNDTCALIESGNVTCWGRHFKAADARTKEPRQVGEDLPPSAEGSFDLGGKVKQVAVGGAHVCALLEDGRVRCSGASNDGVLGYMPDEGKDPFVQPGDARDLVLGGRAIQIATRLDHTCAVLEGGRLRCWGAGSYGQLGYGDAANVGTAKRPLANAGDVDVGGKVVQVATGAHHTCALLEGGRVRCWGHGAYGQLGFGDWRSLGNEKPPAAYGDVPVGGPVVKIAAGSNHTCALLEGGRVRCWGVVPRAL